MLKINLSELKGNFDIFTTAINAEKKKENAEIKLVVDSANVDIRLAAELLVLMESFTKEVEVFDLGDFKMSHLVWKYQAVDGHYGSYNRKPILDHLANGESVTIYK